MIFIITFWLKDFDLPLLLIGLKPLSDFLDSYNMSDDKTPIKDAEMKDAQEISSDNADEATMKKPSAKNPPKTPSKTKTPTKSMKASPKKPPSLKKPACSKPKFKVKAKGKGKGKPSKPSKPEPEPKGGSDEKKGKGSKTKPTPSESWALGSKEAVVPHYDDADGAEEGEEERTEQDPPLDDGDHFECAGVAGSATKKDRSKDNKFKQLLSQGSLPKWLEKAWSDTLKLKVGRPAAQRRLVNEALTRTPDGALKVTLDKATFAEFKDFYFGKHLL